MTDSRSSLRHRRIRYGAPWLAILEGYERLHQAHDRLQWAFLALCQQVQKLRDQNQVLQDRLALVHQQMRSLGSQHQELKESLLRSRVQNQQLRDHYHQAISTGYHAEIRARRAEQALVEQEAEYRSLARRYEILQQLEAQLLADRVRSSRQ